LIVTAQLDLLAPPPVDQGVPTFDAIVAAVLVRGDGITLRQIGTADALARELEKGEPDRERVRWMARRLGLDPARLVVAAGGPR
jgi:hypothetical protein